MPTLIRYWTNSLLIIIFHSFVLFRGGKLERKPVVFKFFIQQVMRSAIAGMGFLVMVLAGCKSSTYYGAVHKNEEKFTGSKKEMALQMVDVQNAAQFVKNLAVLARENASLRTTFLAASEVETLMNDFIFDLNVFATRTGIKLPGALSNDADRDYQFLEQQVSSDKFDQYYLNESLRYLSDLEQQLKQYSTDGEEEQGRVFSSKQLTAVNKSFTRLQSAKNEVAAQTSSN